MSPPILLTRVFGRMPEVNCVLLRCCWCWYFIKAVSSIRATGHFGTSADSNKTANNRTGKCRKHKCHACQKQLLLLSCLSSCFHMEWLGSHWIVFHEILFLNVYEKFLKKIHVYENLNKNWYFMCGPIYVYDCILLISS
jgi:hypothetical protein